MKTRLLIILFIIFCALCVSAVYLLVKMPPLIGNGHTYLVAWENHQGELKEWITDGRVLRHGAGWKFSSGGREFILSGKIYIEELPDPQKPSD